MTPPSLTATLPADDTTLRVASARDLGAVNAVVERAVMGWDLPERVKRLSLPMYRYQVPDFDAMEVLVVEYPEDGIVAVAAWEPADAAELPTGRSGALLHGLYVDPAWQRRGIGARLVWAVASGVRDAGLDGVLVRAKAAAAGFFEALGMERMPESRGDRDYPHRFWMSLR